MDSSHEECKWAAEWNSGWTGEIGWVSAAVLMHMLFYVVVFAWEEAFKVGVCFVLWLWFRFCITRLHTSLTGLAADVSAARDEHDERLTVLATTQRDLQKRWEETQQYVANVWLRE